MIGMSPGTEEAVTLALGLKLTWEAVDCVARLAIGPTSGATVKIARTATIIVVKICATLFLRLVCSHQITYLRRPPMISLNPLLIAQPVRAGYLEYFGGNHIFQQSIVFGDCCCRL